MLWCQILSVFPLPELFCTKWSNCRHAACLKNTRTGKPFSRYILTVHKGGQQLLRKFRESHPYISRKKSGVSSFMIPERSCKYFSCHIVASILEKVHKLLIFTKESHNWTVTLLRCFSLRVHCGTLSNTLSIWTVAPCSTHPSFHHPISIPSQKKQDAPISHLKVMVLPSTSPAAIP